MAAKKKATKKAPLKALPKAEPKFNGKTTCKLSQSQQIVLQSASEQAAQIQQRALMVVCGELGLALPQPGQKIEVTQEGELVIG